VEVEVEEEEEEEEEIEEEEEGRHIYQVQRKEILLEFAGFSIQSERDVIAFSIQQLILIIHRSSIYTYLYI
jgi:hypothetical protein